MLNREARKELEQYKLELKRKELERKQLISSKMDWAALQEFIKKCNDNPGLHIKCTLADGTVIDLCTEKEQRKVNPLFTSAAYDED